MNILLGFANALSRDFAQQNLASAQPQFNIITASTLAECISVIEDEEPVHLVALDLAMPDMGGVKGFRKFKSQSSRDLPVAVIGPKARHHEIKELLLAGAAGYLPYSLSAEALVCALNLIAAGETFLPSDVMNDDASSAVLHRLTGREQQVLSGLLAGRSNKEIADQLHLSEVTIKHHLKGLRSKLGARNRTHAVCRAIELGIG